MEYLRTGVLVLLTLKLVSDSKGCDNAQPLGVANSTIIPNSQMSASTSFKEAIDYLTPKYGRVNSPRAWCPHSQYGYDWLRVDMGELFTVCGVATQGKQSGAQEWTTSYWVDMSREGITWEQYKEGGKPKVFQGNTDVTSIVRHNFKSLLWRRYVRFHPVTYVTFPCLRVEIYVQIVAPTIKEQPKPSTIVAGENLLLNCKAKGSPNPKITWKLNGNDVIFGKQMANGSLWVEKVENDKSFEGKYGCVATNRGGSVVSQEADVVIHEKPRMFESSQAQRSILDGATAVLSCYATGEPAPTITWTKDGSTHIPRATIYDDGHVLVITKVSEIDQGVYQCRALNYRGEAKTTIAVTVKGSSSSVKSDLRLSINTLLTRKTIRSGLMEPVNIGCFGNCSIPLTYRWSKDKVPITGNHGNNHIKVFDNILVVTPKEAKDYGTYVCHVTNGENSTEFEIELLQFTLETNKSGPMYIKQQRSSSGQRSSTMPLAIIIPLALVLVLSIAINVLLIYRSNRHKTLKTSPKPIPMTATTATTGHSKLFNEADEGWDNLMPQSSSNDGHRGYTTLA